MDLEHNDGLKKEVGERLWTLKWKHPGVPRFIPKRFQEHVRSMRIFRRLGVLLNAWEKEHDQTVELVFFACIYDHQFRHARTGIKWLRRPWSGLYLHNRAFRKPGSPFSGSELMPCPEKIAMYPNLRSLAVLDEAAVAPLSNFTCGKNVVFFPDLIDTSTAPELHPLEKKIRDFANGRKVVGCLGQLQPSKGLIPFARVAIDPAFRDIFFVIAGKCLWDMYTPDEQHFLRSVVEATPNVFVYYERISDGPAFNGAVKSCDALCASYLDFTNSSNMLTKAAWFEKPIIVSDGYLMAERVRQFRLGEVIQEGDTEQLGLAIRSITNDIDSWKQRSNPRWYDYRSEHDFERLTRAFRAITST
jgi:glycosyltransferase involved in cell wall biosynthesis